MDNLRSVIKILFRYTSPNEVLAGNVGYDNIKIQRDSFILLANTYMPHYSNNEINNMLDFFQVEFQWNYNKMHARERGEDSRTGNVFDALVLFTNEVLVECDDVPLCKYENLLRWRDISIAFDEDMFITAFLAAKDIRDFKNRTNFFWPPVIGHNNKALNFILSHGVAENHFHLKGSSPTFHLSWQSMMNRVNNPRFKKIFDEYEKRRLNRKITYKKEYSENALYLSYLQAALIRLYLFTWLMDDYVTIRGDLIMQEVVIPYIVNVPKEIKEELDKGIHNTKLHLDDYAQYLPPNVYKKMKQDIMTRDVLRLLHHPDEFEIYLDNIQQGIYDMQEKYAYDRLDYTLSKSYLVNSRDHLNEIISGERWFLYEIFKKIYSEDKKFQHNNKLDLFYVYLLIKETIRAELIQVNDNVGFNNFLLYQDRKESFIEHTPYEKIYLRMAVRDTIKNQHILSLEARITPKNSAVELRDSILKNDKYILEMEADETKEELKRKYFYVCHFIKDADKAFIDDKDKFNRDTRLSEYRHNKLRKIVRCQALAIFNCRNNYEEMANRIKGIDAASEEIGCRPEVFAQAFRFLGNSNLRITYHVGEDFLDILDGLRAIDETISFLGLTCGDRLGHALALGVDVCEWYKGKGNRILISKMDYLDNLVWLYAKIRKYRLLDCGDALKYIEKRYDEYFRDIYLNNINSNEMKNIMNQAYRYYKEKEIKNHYIFQESYFTINTYYDAWKLRGDNPELYRDGYFKIPLFLDAEWDEYAINKNFPENYRIRYNPEAVFLYYSYHYNSAIKKEGAKKVEIKMNPCIIKAVVCIQNKMQWDIAQRGICIETNPSSNTQIGTFKRYDKHPILKWYNKGLTINDEELRSVAQIPVSINTDDQGVFATYIENEYAYLALALEKMKNENGEKLFSRTLIYQWLDNVREMGLMQSFLSS